MHFLKIHSRLSLFLTAYLFSAMNYAYDLYPDLNSVLKRPEQNDLFDGKHRFESALSGFPSDPKEYFKPEFIASVAGDVLTGKPSPILEALKKNDVYDWKSRAPIRFFHSRSDDLVPVENTEVAFKRMQELGGPVSLRLYDGKGHVMTAIPALLEAYHWFQTVRNNESTR